MQKTLDKLLPKWVYYVLLAIAVLYANYFFNMSAIYSTLPLFAFEQASATSVLYMSCALMTAAQFGIFELISRVYYNYVLRGTNFKGLTCTKNQFVDILRVFFIFKCIAVGSANLIVYFLPYFIPLAVNVFNLFFSVIFYYLFFLYIKNKYVNKEIGGRTFIHLAIPFMVYSILVLIFNVI